MVLVALFISLQRHRYSLFSSLLNSPPSLDSWTCRASFTKLHHQYIASIYGSNPMPRSACRIVDQSLRDIVCRAGKWRESPFTHHPHPTWKHLVDLYAYDTLMYAFDALIDSSLTYHTSSAQGRFYVFHGPHQIRSRRESNRGTWMILVSHDHRIWCCIEELTSSNCAILGR